jgi:PhoH-like ATPase
VKIYVLDTSTIIYHPFCYKSFKKNTVIIPIPVLEELDKLKAYQDETGKNARTFLRTLDNLIKTSKEEIHKGISIDDDIILKIETDISMDESLGSPLYGDNRILSYMLHTTQTNKNTKVILVSKDIGLRVRARAYGVLSEDYIKDTYSLNDVPVNHKYLDLTDEEVSDYYTMNSLDVSDEEIERLQLKSNNFVSLRDSTGTDITQTRYMSQTKTLKPLIRTKNLFGIGAKNLEQQFAIDLLLDNDVKLVVLSGPSGTGKTLLAIAAGLYNLMERSDHKYEKLIIMKPVVSVGKDLGALPGTKEEKLSPYLASYYDNINFLMKNSKQSKGNKNNNSTMDPYLSLLMENGTIEIEAISYLRGRSLPNAFIIIDEIQNNSIHELKTILTRIGEGSKIVLLGDESQIDNMSLSIGSNALATVINKFSDYPIAGNVSLITGERSELATLASEIL